MVNATSESGRGRERTLKLSNQKEILNRPKFEDFNFDVQSKIRFQHSLSEKVEH